MNKEKLTLGSLFSGSGGFELAGILSGIQPVWSSEIEPFAIRVTTKRLPGVQHFGDVSSLSGHGLPPVDIITFGSPCQDMSVAGKRAGLDAERSGLFHQAIRIIREMREETNGEKPRYCVWENVPGAFSSNGGADFKSVLEAVIGIKEPSAEVPAPGKNGWPYADVYVGDGWSVAYRLLDAQYWGVPQRRARIFLVADLGGESAGDILFKSEGLSGYSAEGFEAWKRTARDTESRAGETGYICLNDQGGDRMNVSEDVAGTLRAQEHGHTPAVIAAGFCTEHSAKSRSIGYGEETSPTLRAGVVPAAIALEHHPTDSRIGIDGGDAIQTLTGRMGTGGNNVPLIMAPEGPLIPYTLKIHCGKKGGGKGVLVQEDKPAMLATYNDQTLFAPAASGITAGLKAYPIEGNGQRPSHLGDGWNDSDAMYTLNATEQHGVAYGIDRATYNMGQNAKFDISVRVELEPTIVAKGPGAVAQPVYSASKASFFTEAEEDMANTLVATDYKDPPIVNGCSYGFYPQMKAEGMAVTEEVSGTLINGTNPGSQNGVVGPEYIVRRLTPTECARLQGFPDWWCRRLGTEDPTEEDVAFWEEVFETHRRLVTKAKKPKTRNQIVKWLRDPHLDSAEYRLWGNGVALPCVWFVLAGIVWAHEMHNHGE